MYLLDTNACIRVLNSSSVQLLARLHRHSPAEIALCAVVKAELIYGAYRSRRVAQNLRLLNSFFRPFISYPLDDAASEHYGRLRSDLARSGMLIGPNDLMIAAIAIANEATLVTANTGEFSRVAGLTLENWEVAADLS